MLYYTNFDLTDIAYVDEEGNSLIEKWAEIPNFNGKYLVSDLGRIKSLRFKSINRELIMKPRLKKDGYLDISLTWNKVVKCLCIHKIVAISYIGEVKEGFVIDHINNIHTDNRLKNLQIITIRENATKDRINKTGFTGVSYKKKDNKYESNILIESICYSLGLYITAKEASEEYKKALYNWETYKIKPESRTYSSSYKGVSYIKESNKFRANIMLGGIKYLLGEYLVEEEASRVYNIAKENYTLFRITPELYVNLNANKYPFISYYKPYNKWYSKYKDESGKIKFIGYFSTEEEAYQEQQKRIKTYKNGRK